jgi:spore coat polysaccharide biosynthesis predicted glycosyltransferase SpsG/CMP-N-acetylneuraminic acid synthetase
MKKKHNSPLSIHNSQLLIVIPAIKKNAVIPDQLIKKLNGITLIQRAINIAKELVNEEQIFVLTDSEEIGLICERNNINFYKDSKLKLTSENIIEQVISILKPDKDIILFRANTPLVKVSTLKKAYYQFKKNRANILVSVKKVNKRLYENNSDLSIKEGIFFEEVKSFYIFNSKISKYYSSYVLEEEESIEIETYQDWWVCEKLLQRKRIVFNVIGNIKVGMGHIYRALTLAHEITDHEIIFVCKKDEKLAVEKIAAKDYKVIASEDVKKTILELNVDLVINDILNTDKNFILALKRKGIKVVNFEDLGTGVKYANLVFNEIYNEPLLEHTNIYWGYEWYFLRDEFENANINKFKKKVEKILITFGGTDQHNLTLKTLKAVWEISKKYNIKIDIVCGEGYLYKEQLQEYINALDYNKIFFTYQTGVMSQKMENTQIAITSNGRTVYELAHMSIPAIVISQHQREAGHNFSKLENGFISIGKINNNIEKDIIKYFHKLVTDDKYRYLLYLNTKRFNFLHNKTKVVKKILELIK